MLCFLPRQSDRERAPFYASAMRQSDKDRVRPPLHMLASLGAHCLIMPAYAWCSVSFFSVHFATLTPLADSDIRGFFHIVTELDYPRRRLLLVHLLCSVPCVAPSAFFMTTFLDGLCSWCHGQFTTCVCCIFSRIFFCCSRIRARSLFIMAFVGVYLRFVPTGACLSSFACRSRHLCFVPTGACLSSFACRSRWCLIFQRLTICFTFHFRARCVETGVYSALRAQR
jgi:hypothetical protein